MHIFKHIYIYIYKSNSIHILSIFIYTYANIFYFVHIATNTHFKRIFGIHTHTHTHVYDIICHQKLRENLQATGEAKYTNDIQSKFNDGECLYGAFVKSTVPLAIFEKMDTSIALEINGVIDVLTAEDVSGKNDVDIKHPGVEQYTKWSNS